MEQQGHDLPISGTYLGIDASLTSTGIAWLVPGLLSTKLLRPKITGVARLAWYDSHLQALLEHAPTYVAVEGYAYGKINKGHDIGELGGVLRLAMFRKGVKFTVVPPGTLKKFVTGSGKGSKSPIALNLYKRWGLDVEQEDMADATGLALAVAAACGEPVPGLIQTQREALTKVNVDAPAKPRIRTRSRRA